MLLLSGLVHADGQIELGTFYWFEEGIVDDVEEGDLTLQLRDIHGQLVEELSFGVADTLLLDPFLPVRLDVGLFAFSIPYPDNIQNLHILRNDVPVIDIVVTTQLIHDAVDAIPDFGFTENPDQMRKALHNKVSEVDEKIRSGDIEGAVNKLQYDVRKHLEMWLVDDYQPENVLQYSKTGILALVDEMIERLASDL